MGGISSTSWLFYVKIQSNKLISCFLDKLELILHHKSPGMSDIINNYTHVIVNYTHRRYKNAVKLNRVKLIIIMFTEFVIRRKKTKGRRRKLCVGEVGNGNWRIEN